MVSRSGLSVMYNSSQEVLRCKPFRIVWRDATSAPRKFTQGVSSDTYVVGNATRAFWGSGKAMLRSKARLLLHCTALHCNDRIIGLLVVVLGLCLIEALLIAT
jgi:hypothetical protein